MKKVIILLIAVVSIALTGCGGGGGGGGGSPAPSPAPTIDPCAQYRNDGRNSAKYMTDEYCRNIELARLGTSTAYSNGYTGNGVTIAIIDSGVELNNYDIEDNALTNGISYMGKHYNTTTSSIENTSAGVTSDQIEKILLNSGGSGYTTAPTVTISGDGTGAEAIALLDGSGEVSGIYMTERGSGYTNVSFSIDDSGTGGSGASIDDFYFGAYDDFGHGTGVAGIAAGVKQQADVNATYDGFSIQGVAYNADILSVKVLDETGWGNTWQIEKGIDYSVSQGAQVLNMSIGTLSQGSFSGSKSHFTDAITANSTFVIASGNDGKNCLPVNGSINGECSFPAALPWLSGNSDLLNGDGGWIVVGSVDSNNEMYYSSNKAGVTKNNYLVAPGVSILSPNINGNQSYNTGTSFATPFVSGAMALMIEKYPHLKGKDVAQIFFDTAKDLGVAGIDDVYGNGLIDIHAAFAPIGSLGITAQGTTSKVDNNKKTAVSKTTLNLSSVAGAGLIHSQALESTVAFDDYGRGFKVDMTSAVTVSDANAFSFDNFFMFHYGNVILGLDQINQKGMLGYKITQDNRLMLSYDNTLFGSSGEGALGFDNAHTIYSSLDGVLSQEDSSIRVTYQLDYGYAQSSTSKESLITNISDIHALGGSLRAYYGNFGIGYKIPLTTVAGKMELSIPVSREIDGTVNYIQSSEDMKNKDFQQDASLFYEMNSKNFSSLISYELIKNYGGIKNDEVAQRLSLNVRYLF